MCWGESEDAARSTAHRYFRWSAAGWPVQAELPNPKGFAAASRSVTPDDIASKITCGPNAQKHLDAIRKYEDAGFTHLILVQIGPDQDQFLTAFQDKVRPKLGK